MTDVPALPDLRRLTTYSSVNNITGPLDVGFPLYGTGPDYESWLEVRADGVRLSPVTSWTLDSVSGPIATLPRPITNARVTFTGVGQHGFIEIDGRQRPRRTSQLVEGRGITAHDFNLIITAIIVMLRETFDRLSDEDLPAELAAFLNNVPSKTFLGNVAKTSGPVQALTPGQVKSNLLLELSDVISLVSVLATKAALVHTHTIAQVTGLQAALDSILAGAALPIVRFATLASLKADTTEANNTLGLVFADPAIATVSWSRTTNVVTLISATHGFSTGQAVNLRLMGTAALNGIQPVTVVNATTVTFPNVGADVGSTADTAGRLDHEGIWQWHTGDTQWDWIAPAPFEQLDARLDVLEAGTNDFFGAGGVPSAGDVFYSSGEGPGRGGFAGRYHLRERVSNPQVFSNAASFQVLVSPGVAPPATFVTQSLDGTFLRLQSTFASSQHFITALSNLGQLLPNRSFEAEFMLVASDEAHSGVGITFSATPPATSGALGILDVSAETLSWRANGAAIVYERDAFTNIGTTIVYSGASSSAWKNGSIVKMVVACDELATSADTAFIIEGSVAARGRLTGLTPQSWVGAAVRLLGVSDVRIRQYKVDDPNDGVKRNWYVDPSVGATGNGTTRSPWLDFKDAVAEDNSDPIQGYYDIVMKKGICLSAPDFATKKVREVVLRSVAGHGAFIYNAVPLPIGGGVFTRPDAGPNPNVWQITLPASVNASAQLVDATATQTNGRTGSKTTEFAHLSRAAFDTAIGTINTKSGWSTVHTTGTYTGKLLFNPGGGIDPNTHKYWLARGPGIGLIFNDQDGWNAGRLTVDGMGFGFCLGAGILVERGYLDASNVDIFGIVGNGIQANQSDYKLYGGLIRGTYFDNFNCQGGLGGVPPDRKLNGQVFGTRFWGCPTGLLDGAVFGDCFSVHAGHEVYLDGCEFLAGAKDGCGNVGRFTMKDSIIDDCVQYGVELAVPEEVVFARVIGSRIGGCLAGIAVTGLNFNATLEIDGRTLLHSNVSSSLKTAQLGAGISKIRAYDWAVSGTTPLLSHYDTSGGGTIEKLSGTPANLGTF